MGIRLRQACPIKQLSILGLFLFAACRASLLKERPDLVLTPEGPVVIELEETKPRMSVKVMLNGHGPLLMDVDTGAGPLVLSNALVREMDLPIRTVVGGVQGVSGQEYRPFDVAKVDEVLLGDVAMRGLEAFVIGDSLGVRGLLGFALFNHCYLVLDAPNGSMTLSPASSPPVGPLEGQERVTFSYSLINETPHIELELGGRMLRFAIDTGLPGALHLPRSVLGELTLEAEPVTVGTRVTVNRTEGRIVARLAGDLLIGSSRFERPIVGTGGGKPLIGMGVLREFKLTFNPWRRTVSFDRIPGSPVQFESIWSYGFRSTPFVDGESTILSVLDGGPAFLAGLRKGDRVIGMSRLFELAQLPSSPTLSLEVRRSEGQQMSLTIKPGIVVP